MSPLREPAPPSAAVGGNAPVLVRERECREYDGEQRSSSGQFDLVAFAVSQARTPAIVAEYEQAGATWWMQAVDPLAESLGDFRARILRGPVG